MRKLTLKDKILSLAAAIVYGLWMKTIRVRSAPLPSSKCIYVFWHGTMFPLLYVYRNKKISVLVSKHRDGQIAGKILKWYGYNPIYGSSTRGGFSASRQIVELLNNGHQIAITPDGPRGPRYVFKEGALRLSKITKAPLYLLGVKFSKKIDLNSWDKFHLPLPFSRCFISIEGPYDGTSVEPEEMSYRLNRLCGMS